MITNDRRCELDASSCNSQSKEYVERIPIGGKCNRGASPKKGHSLSRQPKAINVEVSVRIENGTPTKKEVKKIPTDSNCVIEQKPIPAPEEDVKSDPVPAKFVTSSNPGIGELWKAGTSDNVYGFNLTGGKSDPVPAKFITSPNPGIGETWKAGTAQNISGFNETIEERGQNTNYPMDELSPLSGARPMEFNALARHLQYANVLDVQLQEFFEQEQLTNDELYQSYEFAHQGQDPLAPYLTEEVEVVPLEQRDIQEDRAVLNSYNKYFLSRSKLTPSLRAALIDWLTAIQVATTLDTTVLHIAALILDHYVWTYPVTTTQYILVALAALPTAANFSRRTFITNLLDALIQFSNHSFRRMDLCNMSSELTEGFSLVLAQAIPHRFLSNCMLAMSDLNRPADRRCFVALCLYCFDLGLLDWRLVRYPASMKCAAVVFLIRSILPNYCTCSHNDLHNANNGCSYHRLEPWTTELANAIHYEDTPELHEVAQIYLSALNEAQRLIDAGVPESVPDCSPPFKAAFHKHSHSAYLNIALKRVRTMSFI